jgi:hypothetical protein
MANQITAIQSINSELEATNKILKKTLSSILLISKESRDLNSNFYNIKVPSDVNDKIQKTGELTSKLTQQVEKQRLSELKLQKAREKAFDNFDKMATKESAQRERNLKQIAKEASAIEKAAKVSKELGRALNVATRKRNELAKVITDLNVKRNLGNKLSIQEQSLLKKSTTSFDRYDKAIRKANEGVGRFQANVGNYPTAFRGAIGAARNLASALGLVGGAFLLVRVAREAIDTIREFGSTMSNIAGIYRTSRADLGVLEDQIISIAGSSVKTATDVAKLAESLATLGKSKEEIADLLKPVNDLSIGLNASSEDAAEFLIQTINAFGGSSKEAAEYADVIATIRTSTSLDFQKMRDSFQYLTPISRILNKDLAFTGALIGILADNGIKAERAGRLLGTAQQKLAKEGKTLSDGLEEVNQASKEGVKEIQLLEIASDLFGKQAASLGIILANNSDIIDTNAQAIRDNGGALDDLVNEQLTSLDSHFKILNSRIEEFILNTDESS